MRYRSSFSPSRSIERTFLLTQIPITECAARSPHHLPRVRSLAAFGRRPLLTWHDPSRPAPETLNTSGNALTDRKIPLVPQKLTSSPFMSTRPRRRLRGEADQTNTESS